MRLPTHGDTSQSVIVTRTVRSGWLTRLRLVNAGRGFRLFVGRERHLRWYALLTVSRGGVTTAPIPKRVIAFRLVKWDALSPRVNPSCDIRGSVNIGLNVETCLERVWDVPT